MAEQRVSTQADRSGLSFRKIESSAIRDNPKYPIDYDNHRMWFRASTDQLCPDGIVIDAEAWRKHMPDLQGSDNVPLLDSHNYQGIGNIIGRPVAYEIDKTGLLLQCDFAAGDAHPDGRMAWYLASEGYLKAGSVGWSTLERAEEKTDGGQSFTRVTQARLEEFSLCVKGMDDKALAVKGNPMAVAAIRAFNPEGGGTDVTTRFTELENVELEVVEEPDRIGEALERLERIEAAVDELCARIAFEVKTITSPSTEDELEIDESIPDWLRSLREVAEADTRTGKEVLESLEKH